MQEQQAQEGTRKLKYPTYLNCPYCPAQTLPTGKYSQEKLLYVCPTMHKVWIEGEK